MKLVLCHLVELGYCSRGISVIFGRPGRVGHEEEVHRPVVGGGAGDVGRDRWAAGRIVAEGAAGAVPAEGRRGRPGLDRRRDRRGLRLPAADGREPSRAVRHRRIRIGLGRLAASVPGEVARRGAGSEGRRPADGFAAGGVRELVAAAAGRAGRGARNRRIDQLRNGPPHPEKAA